MATTITIKEETKKLLESIKGKKNWDLFLKEMTEEYIKIKREKARVELRKLFIEDFETVKVKDWAREY